MTRTEKKERIRNIQERLHKIRLDNTKNYTAEIKQLEYELRLLRRKQ